MATYVLVHGGGHGAWCWDRVSGLLRDAGHEVHTPARLGGGERAHLVHPGVDLDSHVDEVVELIRDRDLVDVILVGHSYGGMVITGVADRAAGESPSSSTSTRRTRPTGSRSSTSPANRCGSPGRDRGGRRRRARAVAVPGDGPVLRSRRTRTIWPGCRTGSRPTHGVASSNRCTCATRPPCRIPRTSVICTESLRTIRSPMRWPGAEPAWEIDTGHDLMITEAAAVTEMLLESEDLDT